MTADGYSTVTLGPVAKVATDSTTHDSSTAYANAELRYYVSFTTPPSNYNFLDGYHDVFEPLTINYASGVSGSATGVVPIWTASSQIDVEGGTPSGYSTVLYAYHACSQTTLGNCGQFAGQTSYSALVFSYYKSVFNGSPYVNIYPAEIKVDLLIGVDTISESSATAFADPQFIIDDPDSPVQLTFSAGVGNGAPGVPEPATWLYLLTGFGVAGGLLRGRRMSRA
jgi:hypothetical protein